ncbi:MAG: transporter substrate-binding domain-containing protein [Alphaproteobacteria bacterium]|nr:transporter substrate-binding domain-containing protein [Alphaproteobacteria bacterium]
MNYAKFFSLLALVVALAALGKVYTNHAASQSQTAHKETAYERVIRTRTLRCGYALWPVVEDIDPTTKVLKGTAPDFANALAAKLDIKIKWVQEVIWGEQVEALNSGKIDAICAPDGPFVYPTAALVDYAEPMAYTNPTMN